MSKDNRPSIKLNFQLVRYHAEVLMEQIAALEDQIEENLEKKQAVMHLRNMIQERQRSLSEYIEIAKSTNSRTTRQSSLR